jgi:hypothetical protein
MPPTIEAQAQLATAKLAELKAAYDSSPEQVAARERAELNRLQNDPDFLGRPGAARDVQNMEARVASLERSAEQSEAQRIDAILRGENVAGAETTTGDQIPRRDLATAMVGLMERGVRAELVDSFLKSGRSDLPAKDRATEIAAADEWYRQLMADPSKQQRLMAGDPELLRQLTAYGVYAAAPHEK